MTLPLEPHTDTELAAMKRWADTTPAPESFDATAALRRVLGVIRALEVVAAESEAEGVRPFVDARVVANQFRAALTGPADTTERDGA